MPQLFNQVCGLRWGEDGVKGLVTVEGEELHFASPVALLNDGTCDGMGVGAGVQRVLNAMQSAMMRAVQRDIEELGMEKKLT